MNPSRKDWRSILSTLNQSCSIFIDTKLPYAQTSPKTMIGTIAFTSTNLLTIEDLQISIFTLPNSARTIIQRLGLVATWIVSSPIPLLRDFTIRTSTRPTFARILVNGRSLAQKVSYVPSSITTSNRGTSLPAK